MTARLAPLLRLPYAGEARRAREKIEAYKHLSPEQKAKLLAALDAKEAAAGSARQLGPQELRTEVRALQPLLAHALPSCWLPRSLVC